MTITVCPFIDCICNPFSPPMGDASTRRRASDKKRNQMPAKGKASVLSTSPKKPPAAASKVIEIMSSDVESDLPVTPIKYWLDIKEKSGCQNVRVRCMKKIVPTINNCIYIRL